MNNSGRLGGGSVQGFLARFEGICAILFLALLAALKLVYASTLRIDSDEPQHLHVVWGWTNGLLPYRDFFDNHSPLFQFLCVPLFRALGERADIIIPMRLAMVPLYFLCLWCVYRCGALLYSRRIGLWAAILTGAYPSFFAKSSQFRTDDLWTVFWLLTILALLKRPFGPKNAFLAGLALGASFATSMKTSALVISLAVALIVILASKIIRKASPGWKRLTTLAGAAMLGASLIPAMIVAFFAGKGALPNLYYGTIQHNLLPGLFRLDLSTRLRLVPLAVLTGLGGYRCLRDRSQNAIRDRIAMITLTSLALCMLLGLYWPLFESQDVLPIAPLVFLLVVPAIWIILEPAVGGRLGRAKPYVLPLLAGAEVVALLASYPPTPHAVDETTARISDVLTLTRKDDYVMDAKGEMIFRHRPFYYALEGVTMRRFQLGLIKDEIPERLIATRTPVATILRTPPRARHFIEQNYLPVGLHLRVLGQMLATTDQNFPKSYSFEIVIPANYQVLSEQGDFSGDLDGTTFDGPRFLSAGRHQVRALAGTGRLALIWSRAQTKGFSPFSPQAVDVPTQEGY